MLRFTLVYAPKIYERKSPGIGRKFKCLTQATPLGSAFKSSVSSSATGYPRESPVFSDQEGTYSLIPSI